STRRARPGGPRSTGSACCAPLILLARARQDGGERRPGARALTFSLRERIVERRRPHGNRALRSVSALQRPSLVPRGGRWQHDDPCVSTLSPADHGLACHLLDGRSLPSDFESTQEQVVALARRTSGAARAIAEPMRYRPGGRRRPTPGT